MLKDYEAADAHSVTIEFSNKAQAKAFQKHADNEDAIAAMRAGGFEPQARRVMLNHITMAMVSDCLHHIYEALRCLEKRKVIVALNLLRKPLTDNLLYLAWMLGDESGFYDAFVKRSPDGITSSRLKQNRREILGSALSQIEIDQLVSVEFLDGALFDQRNEFGLQRLFQHAVHLITVARIEFKTTPENFNFIFKNYADNDLYEAVYEVLPTILFFLSHVIFALYRRMVEPEESVTEAFFIRSVFGLLLISGPEGEAYVLDELKWLQNLQCPGCGAALNATPHNAGRVLLTETCRCTKCRHVILFPFSWMLGPDGVFDPTSTD